MHETELRRLIERRQKAYLWGQPNWITPRLVSEVFGDGKQLIGIAPINYRPNYFVVRIDSTWIINNHARDCELLIDNIDEIYDAIEEEYPNWPWYRAYGLKLNVEHGEELSEDPDFSCGSEWWGEDRPKRSKRKLSEVRG